jgi:hypothetical protein
VHAKLKEEIDKLPSGRLSTLFKPLKEQIFCVEYIFKEKPDLENSVRKDLIRHISLNGMDGLASVFKSKESKDSAEGKGLLFKMSSWISDEHSNVEQKIRRHVRDRIATIPDAQFLAGLDDMLHEEPLLHDMITQAVEVANESLQSTVPTLLPRFVGRAVLLTQETLKSQVQRKTAGKLEDQRKVSRLQLIEEYEHEIPASPYVMDLLIVI